LIRDYSTHDQTNIEDNRILLSGIESYYAPNEETLINVNFCAFFQKEYFWRSRSWPESSPGCHVAHNGGKTCHAAGSCRLRIADTGGGMLSHAKEKNGGEKNRYRMN